MLFTVRILGASSYETHRANDTASLLVTIPEMRVSIFVWIPFFVGRVDQEVAFLDVHTCTHRQNGVKSSNGTRPVEDPGALEMSYAAAPGTVTSTYFRWPFHNKRVT